MQQRTKLKNVSLIVMALLFPPFAAVTTTPCLLVFHSFWLVLLVWSSYVSVNKANNPKLDSWLSSPVKTRDFIFDALIDFFKIELVLAPCLYMLLSVIGYEQDERNQASMMQLIMTFSLCTWCYWFITKSVCAYAKANRHR
ncbi:hypothetical protein BTO19_23230 [Vibrio parahaemolyticus]|uniref:hypothetical protein n=1 Tax=Vibrio parahaemolyticus TaxID=670 RepID=UPI000A3D25A9|nr:hypothetical protein [Vibrio parahaemolyticus]MDF4269721.1 hypothetical protein [Vibrio parahaemolyticus]MDF4275057.1 hypothetical protein [Vibrio parahaemolyticus]MDF4299649.1 hypothetical protein [Vibrio parahaemolyticus]OUJ23213.1 hypothetical protein BTO19_23230 [Vibrio parahaemolyticus]TOH11437.1 hypothetical protein CGI87_24475 [Vibrio parahaemolyticus]